MIDADHTRVAFALADDVDEFSATRVQTDDDMTCRIQNIKRNYSYATSTCSTLLQLHSKKNMQAVQKAAQKKGFIWLSIISSTPGDQGHVSGDQANELTMSRNASPTHILLDESGKIGMQYGAKTTPHMFMIDATGVLRYKGAIDDIGQGMKFFDASFNDSVNYISTQLDAVLKNSELEISNTVAYGCSVKYDY